MCGIAGFIDDQATYDVVDIAKQMGIMQQNRGPDDSGTWTDNNWGIMLIHRRLSILDLSPAGHQPMLSQTGRYVIIFNGEIYNWQEIKSNLETKCGQINWVGHSDTEILLHAFEVYGVEKSIQMSEGMFAIALWDRQENSLYLIRDRMGEKPLYYGYFNGVFAFSSVLTSFKKHPKFNGIINRDALGQLLLHSCIPTPLSIFDGIYKLIPGTYLKLCYIDFKNKVLPPPVKYWQLKDSLKFNYRDSVENAQRDLHALLRKSVSEQIIADVSVGCFLSGGVDSTTVAALMQEQSSRQIKTYSIGFDNPEYNEAVFAKAVANHLQTNHTELYVTGKDALNVVPLLSSIYDEPFSDSSQIPAYLVSKLAKGNVTVALTGDGGDELFAGYNRYLYAEEIYTKLDYSPNWLKQLVKLAPIPSVFFLKRILHAKSIQFENKLLRLNKLMDSKSFLDFYLILANSWPNPGDVVLHTKDYNSLWKKDISSLDFDQQKILGMQYLDSLGYLPDDILTKVDRAAMANSVETRVPLLNHHIVEFAFSLPQSYKIYNGQSKWLLRKILDDYIPRELIERPKMGFAVPLQDWLRGDLKDWAGSLLDKKLLVNQGYFNPDIIDIMFTEHIKGIANNGSYLWDILMFQQWLEDWKTNDSIN